SPPPTATLSLHDALPISTSVRNGWVRGAVDVEDINRLGRCAAAGIQESRAGPTGDAGDEIRGLTRHPISHKGSGRISDQIDPLRSEEHTSELQSRSEIVC